MRRVKIVAIRETREGETRVALVPGVVGRLTALGYEVGVETGAGERAGYDDLAYVDAGATVADDAVAGAALVVSVNALDTTQLAVGTATISFDSPEPQPDIPSFALERVPRLSRAQTMDALTSQALVTGYRGVIVAAELLPRFFPGSMTAAGSVAPARVVVLGAGVAGLEAIATAHRLGARVQGYDVRASSAEEIASLGAEFIDLGLEPLEGAAGYAREMTVERATRQRELLAPHIAAADVLITTAAVPGRPAPLLVTKSMVEQMRAGSVVVDLAAESGGNVEGVVAGETVQLGEARVWGGNNVPAQLPGPASRLYAGNVVSLVELLTRDGRLDPDLTDEVVAACEVP